VLLCVACAETLCAMELLHQSDVFYSSVLQFYYVVQFNLCGSQWNGCILPVLSCKSDCVLQVIVGRSHWNCYHGCDLNVKICTKHCVFSGKRRSVAEKSWLACVTVAGVAALPSDLSRTARFFSSLLLLCYCVLHVLHSAVQFSLRRSHWNGCVKVSRCHLRQPRCG